MCVILLSPGGGRGRAKVVSMVIDVGVISFKDGSSRGGRGPAAKVADQGQGESDCSHPDRKSKRSTPSGGSRKKVQFHKPNYFWDGGEKNITAITAPGRRRREEEEEEAAERRREEAPK